MITGSFKKVVATNGTQVTLSSTIGRVAWLTIQTERTNTGYIYIGGPDVSATIGYELNIPDAAVFRTPEYKIRPQEPGNNIDLSTVWIDSSVNGDGVIVLYGKF